MSKDEAQDIISEYTEPYRRLGYRKLASLIDQEPITEEVKGTGEVAYQIELQVFWDDKPKGDIRFLGSIFESPSKPLFWKYPILRWIPIYFGDLANDDFIMSPKGEFIDE